MKVIDIIKVIEDGEETESLTHLLDAISNWPKEVLTSDEYVVEIMRFLKIEELDVYKIKERMSKFSFKTNAWNLESISEFLLFIEKNSNYKKYIN